MYCGKRIVVKLILAVMKQLKQLQRKPRKNSEASTGFEAMTNTGTMIYQQSYKALLVVN